MRVGSLHDLPHLPICVPDSAGVQQRENGIEQREVKAGLGADPTAFTPPLNPRPETPLRVTFGGSRLVTCSQIREVLEREHLEAPTRVAHAQEWRRPCPTPT